jgi:hypothetical protein
MSTGLAMAPLVLGGGLLILGAIWYLVYRLSQRGGGQEPPQEEKAPADGD